MDVSRDLIRTAKTAFEEEDLQLRQYFESCEGIYSKRHQGIFVLSESVYVYLVFKQFLKDKYLAEVGWEHPYPESPVLHADLSIRSKDDVLALVEFKVVEKDLDDKVLEDAAKLKRAPQDILKLLFLISFYGDIDKRIEWLTTIERTLVLRARDSIFSKIYVSSKNVHEIATIDLLVFSQEA